MDGADDRRRGCSVLCPCIESVRSGPVSSPIVESAPSERLDHLVLTGVATVYFCSTDSAGQGVVIGSAWRCTSCQVPLVSRSSSVSFRASKEDEILIWIRDYKGSRAPWLLLRFLMERDSCSLITQNSCLISLAVATVMEAESRFRACEHRCRPEPCETLTRSGAIQSPRAPLPYSQWRQSV
jgi:hypothetical protein